MVWSYFLLALHDHVTTISVVVHKVKQMKLLNHEFVRINTKSS